MILQISKKRRMGMAKLINKGIVKAAGMMKMDNRINYFKVDPAALETIMEAEKYVRKTSIDRKLKELIKIRVSQINGCSYCLNMHTKGAKKLKVSDEKIDILKNWKKSKDLYKRGKGGIYIGRKYDTGFGKRRQ